jgi:hypothetical protein
MRNILRSGFVSITAIIYLNACSTVPDLEHATGVIGRTNEQGESKNNIFVRDVMERVKCEIAIAFEDKLDFTTKPPHRNMHPEYLWLSNWTVKTDLTLQANEQGGISPSGSYTQYQKSAVLTAAGPTTVPGTTLGTFQQFFSLNATFNAGEQATRTEVLSTTLSLKELDTWRRSKDGTFEKACGPTGQRELLGKLGIGEWIDSSLSPATRKQLLAGTHTTPGLPPKSAPPAFVTAPKFTNIGAAAPASLTDEEKNRLNQLSEDDKRKIRAENSDNATKLLDEIQAAVNSLEDSHRSTLSDLENAATAFNQFSQARDHAAQSQVTYNDKNSTSQTTETLQKVRGYYEKYWESALTARNAVVIDYCGDESTYAEFVGNDNKCTKQSQPESGVWHALETAIKAQKIAESDADHPDSIDDNIVDMRAKRDIAAKAARAGQQATKDADAQNAFLQRLIQQPPSFTPDPPLDSIGHSVQFVVAIGGSVTPSWTLVQWKGPGITAPGASGVMNRTHLLQLAFGQPGSGDQNRIINNNTIFLSQH